MKKWALLTTLLSLSLFAGCEPPKKPAPPVNKPVEKMPMDEATETPADTPAETPAESPDEPTTK